ncbi:hypothetical protein [Streptomyces olivoreticuli]|uniref:hypothetical protein n=1 Tax=Streptomyces olivoreticuli TaxID=68246 RepID=UPI000E21E68C|nr:hypothetical protein [Streptomyces olivoreticuli]
MQKKTRTWITVGAGVLVLGGILSLFEDGKDKAEAEPKPSATAPAKPTEQPSEAAKPASAPSPDATQRETLIRALRTINPGLVAKEDRAVSRSRDVCLDVKGGKDDATVQKNTKSRFEGGTVPSLTDDQAASIVTAVRSSFCG